MEFKTYRSTNNNPDGTGSLYNSIYDKEEIVFRDYRAMKSLHINMVAFTIQPDKAEDM